MHATYSHLYRIVAVVLCLLMMPLPTFSQGQSSSQPAGQITALIPQATRNGALANAKDEVMWNDVVRTEGAGRARIALRDGSVLSVGSNSELKVVQHDPLTQQTELELNYGRVRSSVVHLTKPGAKFQIKTPTAVAGVVGTDFVVVYEGGHMQVMVFSGVVQVIGLAGNILATVNAGQMVELSNGVVSPPHSMPTGVQNDNIAQTSAGHAGSAGGGGGAAGGAAGGGIGAGGTGLLHTILVVVGAAVGGSVVTQVTAGHTPSSTGIGGPTGTPCPDCPPPARPRR